MNAEPEQGRAWSDARDCHDMDPAEVLTAQVVPVNRPPTQILLDGRCPRCRHSMTSVHTVRGPLTQSESCARYLDDSATTETHNYRVIATQCQCAHRHPGTPDGEQGCGAPIGIGVRWPKKPPRQVAWARVCTKPFEHREERQLQETLRTQLVEVRMAAESWRTGLGAFLAVLAAVFFVKGATSFDELLRGWQWVLASLLLISASFAVYGAYRAIRAAYGTPADEYIVGGGRLWPWLRKHVPATTPRHIHDYATVGAWRDALAAQSVTDLRHAKVATILAAIFFSGAACVTWLAPGPAGTERVIVEGRSGSVCGRTVSRRAGVLVIDGAQEVPISDVVSVKPVSACPSR